MVMFDKCLNDKHGHGACLRMLNWLSLVNIWDNFVWYMSKPNAWQTNLWRTDPPSKKDLPRWLVNATVFYFINYISMTIENSDQRFQAMAFREKWRTLCIPTPRHFAIPIYRKICNIRRTKSQNLNDSRLVLPLSLPLPNLLKPGVK